MATRHASAVRQHRRSLKTQERNRQNTARLRTGIKKFRTLLEENKVQESRAQLQPTLSLIDHSVARKSLHRNAAARLKSRLTRHVARLAV